MNELDYVIIAIVVISVLIGLWRGVISEVLAIVGWVLGLILAFRYAGELAAHIPLESAGELTRVVLASVIILVLSLVVVGLLGRLIRYMMQVASLSFEDRLLGGLFGAVRGVVIVCAIVFFFGMSESIQKSQLWTQSSLIAPAESTINWSMPYLPKWLQDLREGHVAPKGPLVDIEGVKKVIDEKLPHSSADKKTP